MPVKKLQYDAPPAHARLVKKLLAEWRDPQPGLPEPVILEEPVSGKLAHVYVVWSEWDDLDQIDRSKIIMDAAEKKLDPQDLLNITIAMGLTPQEAKRMHLKF